MKYNVRSSKGSEISSQNEVYSYKDFLPIFYANKPSLTVPISKFFDK